LEATKDGEPDTCNEAKSTQDQQPALTIGTCATQFQFADFFGEGLDSIFVHGRVRFWV
jgi:hypothetical protein